MGMSETEFRHTTPRYFYFRQKGFEGLQLEAWQRARIQAFYAFLPHAKKGAIKKPEGLFSLPGDAKQLPEITPEKSKQAAELLAVAKTVDWFNGGTMPTPEA